MGRSGRRGRPKGGWMEELSDKRLREGPTSVRLTFPSHPAVAGSLLHSKAPPTANEREGTRQTHLSLLALEP